MMIISNKFTLCVFLFVSHSSIPSSVFLSNLNFPSFISHPFVVFLSIAHPLSSLTATLHVLPFHSFFPSHPPSIPICPSCFLFIIYFLYGSVSFILSLSPLLLSDYSLFHLSFRLTHSLTSLLPCHSLSLPSKVAFLAVLHLGQIVSEAPPCYLLHSPA